MDIGGLGNASGASSEQDIMQTPQGDAWMRALKGANSNGGALQRPQSKIEQPPGIPDPAFEALRRDMQQLQAMMNSLVV